MKRSIVLVIAIIVLLSACATKETVDESSKPGDNFGVGKDAEVTEESVIEEQTDITTYTSEDIYICSYNSGYIENDSRFSNVVIENEEQLAYAMERSNVLPSEEMLEKYPLTEYTYVIEYDEFTNGGYYRKAKSLCIGEDCMYFEMTDNSHNPRPGDSVSCVMDGFVHMAAVPKSYIGESKYSDWIYPDRKDMYQDEDYFAVYTLGFSSRSILSDIYGDTCYLIRNEEEFTRFLAMPETEGEAGLKRLLFENLYLYKEPDFSEMALLIRIFPGYGSCDRYVDEAIRIEGNQIIMDTQIIDDITKRENLQEVCVFYAHIPKEYLTEESYEGWITP